MAIDDSSGVNPEGMAGQFGDVATANSVADEGVQHVNDLGRQADESNAPSGFDKITYKRGPNGRMKVAAEIAVDHALFRADAGIFVGYGMEYQGRFAQLPYIAEVFAEPGQ
jgi:hypothetical protein